MSKYFMVTRTWFVYASDKSDAIFRTGREILEHINPDKTLVIPISVGEYNRKDLMTDEEKPDR